MQLYAIFVTFYDTCFIQTLYKHMQILLSLAIVKPHFYSMSESLFLLAIVKPHFYSMSGFHSETGMELHIQLHSGKVYITETRTRH